MNAVEVGRVADSAVSSDVLCKTTRAGLGEEPWELFPVGLRPRVASQTNIAHEQVQQALETVSVEVAMHRPWHMLLPFDVPTMLPPCPPEHLWFRQTNVWRTQEDQCVVDSWSSSSASTTAEKQATNNSVDKVSLSTHHDSCLASV